MPAQWSLNMINCFVFRSLDSLKYSYLDKHGFSHGKYTIVLEIFDRS